MSDQETTNSNTNVEEPGSINSNLLNRTAETVPTPLLRQRSNDEVSQWQQRIRQIQSERGTPEVISQLREKSARKQQCERAYRDADVLSRVNMACGISNARALCSFGQERQLEAAPKSYRLETDRHETRSAVLRDVTSRRRRQEQTYAPARKSAPVTFGAAPATFGAFAAAPASEATSDNLQDLEEVERSLGEDHHVFATRRVMTKNTHGDDEDDERQQNAYFMSNVAQQVNNNLGHLSNEPTDPEELAAKFKLFENVIDTVTRIREETIQLFEDNRSVFSGAVLSGFERDIRRFDSNEAMGIVDNPRVWFVYTMTKKANENSIRINAILTSFKAKLALLAKELEDCPFCLSPITPETVVTLGCCHRVCVECWDNWVTLKGQQAFCPLCKHQEFVHSL